MNFFFLGKYIVKYFGIKEHGICYWFSNGSEEICMHTIVCVFVYIEHTCMCIVGGSDEWIRKRVYQTLTLGESEWSFLLLFFFKINLLFILERGHTEGRGRGRGERNPGWLHAEHRAYVGSIPGLWHHTTCAETKSLDG